MIEVGAGAQRRLVVDDARTISFMGPDLSVYSTPSMLADIEMTCRDLLKEMLEPGADSVGAAVELTHSGAAVVGSTIDVDVVVAQVDGRKVVFDANVRCNGAVIGTARHHRAVVDVERLKARVRELYARLSPVPASEA